VKRRGRCRGPRCRRWGREHRGPGPPGTRRCGCRPAGCWRPSPRTSDPTWRRARSWAAGLVAPQRDLGRGCAAAAPRDVNERDRTAEPPAPATRADDAPVDHDATARRRWRLSVYVRIAPPGVVASAEKLGRPLGRVFRSRSAEKPRVVRLSVERGCAGQVPEAGAEHHRRRQRRHGRAPTRAARSVPGRRARPAAAGSSARRLTPIERALGGRPRAGQQAIAARDAPRRAARRLGAVQRRRAGTPGGPDRRAQGAPARARPGTADAGPRDPVPRCRT